MNARAGAMRTLDAHRKKIPAWRVELTPLHGRAVLLREPTALDLDSLLGLLSLSDSTRFTLDGPVTKIRVRALIDRVIHDRSDGYSFTYAITLRPDQAPAGLIQFRQLDTSFDTCECECILAPSARGGGVFLEAAQLAGSFAFENVGTRRIESRVPLQNRRAGIALRKLGAVREAILRRSLRRGSALFDQALWSMLKAEWKFVAGSHG
jgi:RimJ/RimL family protein N-acetyltransferase